MTVRTSFSYSLDQAQQAVLTNVLRTGNYRPFPAEHTKIAVRTPDFSVALYNSGKCLVQGKGAADFVTFILEPQVLCKAVVGYETVWSPDVAQPHMGVDESGKGDFFGPLVVASAYVDDSLLPAFRDMDVKDSKKITSDKKALEMGKALRELLGKRFAVVKIGPAAYNRLYARMQSVNTLLAWAHARAIENLLEAVPDCPRAISDQFGSKDQVARALMKKGRKISLVQRHKAESDPAVAAASIIARELFLRSLKELEEKHGVPFPKGASPAVKESAGRLVGKCGPLILIETAKCHFKTADEVLAGRKLTRQALGPDGQAVSKAARDAARGEDKQLWLSHTPHAKPNVDATSPSRATAHDKESPSSD